MSNQFLYVSDPQPDKPLHVLLAGRTDPEDTILVRRERNSGIFVFQWISSGKGWLEEEGIRTACSAGDLLITHAWKQHAYGPEPGFPWSKIWINMTGELPGELLRCYGMPDQCLFREFPEAGRILAKLVAVLPKIPEKQADDFVGRRLHHLIQILRNQNSRNALRIKEDSSAEKLRNFLRAHIMGVPPTLEEMGEHIARSQAQTIRIFRKAFGQTPYAFLLNAKIEAAAEILRQSRQSARDTAKLLGFSNEYYFSRIFKEKKGMPPGEFRLLNDPGNAKRHP